MSAPYTFDNPQDLQPFLSPLEGIALEQLKIDLAGDHNPRIEIRSTVPAITAEFLNNHCPVFFAIGAENHMMVFSDGGGMPSKATAKQKRERQKINERYDRALQDFLAKNGATLRVVLLPEH
jgi:hypothetical protein